MADMTSFLKPSISLLRIGLAQIDDLLRLQADILGIPILRPTVLETTSLGAAFLGKKQTFDHSRGTA